MLGRKRPGVFGHSPTDGNGEPSANAGFASWNENPVEAGVWNVGSGATLTLAAVLLSAGARSGAAADAVRV